jgi:tetratricopeptide (TPR) repeat protein
MASSRSAQLIDDIAEPIYYLNAKVYMLCHHGRYQEAIARATQARDLSRQRLGHDHPTCADSLDNLAVLLRDLGDHAAALPLFRQAVEIRRTALGENYPAYAGSLNYLPNAGSR